MRVLWYVFCDEPKGPEGKYWSRTIRSSFSQSLVQTRDFCVQLHIYTQALVPRCTFLLTTSRLSVDHPINFRLVSMLVYQPPLAANARQQQKRTKFLAFHRSAIILTGIYYCCLLPAPGEHGVVVAAPRTATPTVFSAKVRPGTGSVREQIGAAAAPSTPRAVPSRPDTSP
jgi:hypothetical protein